ncbi:MAG: 16S rRNA (guanine(527)-N(7))-methyltransferase RsmG [Terriglobia bacterium]
MVDQARFFQLLVPFDVKLSASQAAQALAYLDLLMRWNRKINLTAIRSEEECVTRHFGESFLLSRRFDLKGRLLDVGSGAGFPGLPLKIAFPALAVTLLEPVAKKRAFLKEVARVCQMVSVEVRGERLNDFARSLHAPCYETVTSRAVGKLDRLIPSAAECLVPGGRLCLWLTADQTKTISSISPGLSWGDPIPIPLAHESQIVVGTRVR